MKNILSTGVFVVCLSGCWTLDPQVITLSEETQTQLEERFGEDIEAMRQWLSENLRADVAKVVTDESGRLEAVLVPPLQEALETGAESFVGRVVENPTVQDAAFGLFLAVLSGLGVMRYRRGLKETIARRKK